MGVLEAAGIWLGSKACPARSINTRNLLQFRHNVHNIVVLTGNEDRVRQ